MLKPARAGDIFLVSPLHFVFPLLFGVSLDLVRARQSHVLRVVHQLLDQVEELGRCVVRDPVEAEQEPVVLAAVPGVELPLAPVAAERVQPVPQDGQPRPPVRQDHLHAPRLPGPAAPEVEEEDGDDLVPGHVVELQGGGGGGVESGQAIAHIANTSEAGEGRLDERDLRWREL